MSLFCGRTKPSLGYLTILFNTISKSIATPNYILYLSITCISLLRKFKHLCAILIAMRL